MKLIIAFILLIAVTSSLSSEEEESEPKLKLIDIYNHPEFKIDKLDPALLECVKEKLNLSANGQMLVPPDFGLMIIGLSLDLCKSNLDEQLQSNVDRDIKKFSAIDDEVAKVFCLRNKLKELKGADRVEIEECKDVDKVANAVIKRLEEGNEDNIAMGIGDCVNFTADRFSSKLIETILFKFEENVEAHISARTEYFKYIKTFLNETINCVINKYNQ